MRMKIYFALTAIVTVMLAGCASVNWESFRSESKVVENRTTMVPAGELFESNVSLEGDTILLAGTLKPACLSNVYTKLKMDVFYPDGYCINEKCPRQETSFSEVTERSNEIRTCGASKPVNGTSLRMMVTFPATKENYSYNAVLGGDDSARCTGCARSVRQVAAYCGTARITVTPKLPPDSRLEDGSGEQGDVPYQGLRYKTSSLAVEPVITRSIDGLDDVEKNVVLSCLDQGCRNNAREKVSDNCSKKCTEEHTPPQCLAAWRECIEIAGNTSDLRAVCDEDYNKCVRGFNFEAKLNTCTESCKQAAELERCR